VLLRRCRNSAAARLIWHGVCSASAVDGATSQRRADAADGLTSKRSSKKTEGSNMNDETKPAKTKLAKTKPADLWEQTKAWADKNRTISGALLGGAAGTTVPGIGTVIGTIVGAGIGFASSKEKNVPVSGG
jgi:hypothetical protein